MENLYTSLKIIHIISVVCWMAGMFYLPRLFVYHVTASSETAKTFVLMEQRLIRIIMNPAMIATWLSGLYLMFSLGFTKNGWMHTKLLLVLFLSGVHGLLSYHRKKLAKNENTKSERYFRILNEVPTVLFIFIVILVVAKPF